MGKLAALGRSRAATDFIQTALNLQASRQSQERLGLLQRADERAAAQAERQNRLQDLQYAQLEREAEYYNTPGVLKQSPLWLDSSSKGKEFLEDEWHQKFGGRVSVPLWERMKAMQDDPTFLPRYHRIESDYQAKRMESATKVMKEIGNPDSLKYQHAAQEFQDAQNEMRGLNDSVSATAAHLGIQWKPRTGFTGVLGAKQVAYDQGVPVATGLQDTSAFPNLTESQLTQMSIAGDKNAQEILDKMQERKLAIAKVTGEERAKAWIGTKIVPALDTKNNNAPVLMTGNQLVESAKTEPGRFIPASTGDKALQRTALLEDIRDAIGNLRYSLGNLATDFTRKQRMQLALALKEADPRSALDMYIRGEFRATLTPEQIDYVTDLNQLIENAMAMRGVLGAGQGSDLLRFAILAVTPSAATPTKSYASSQLDKFEMQVNRLQRGVPFVKLAEPQGAITTKAKTPSSKTVPGKAGPDLTQFTDEELKAIMEQ